MARTIFQLIKEFWVPFIVACGWVAYDLYTNVSHRNLTAAIPIFGGTFFLCSWLTGNIVRVRRQARVEDKLTGVGDRIEGLVEELSSATRRIVDTVTGGDSFPYLLLARAGGDSFWPCLLAVGEHNLANVSAQICDLNRLQSSLAAGTPFAAYQQVSAGELLAGSSFLDTQHVIVADSSGTQDFNVGLTARNGRWSQAIRLRKVAGEWEIAHVVSRDGQPIYGHVRPGFPMIGEQLLDSFERSDEPRQVETVARQAAVN